MSSRRAPCALRNSSCRFNTALHWCACPGPSSYIHTCMRTCLPCADLPSMTGGPGMQAVQGLGTVAPTSQETAFVVRLRFPKPSAEPKPDPTWRLMRAGRAGVRRGGGHPAGAGARCGCGGRRQLHRGAARGRQARRALRVRPAAAARVCACAAGASLAVSILLAASKEALCLAPTCCRLEAFPQQWPAIW